MVMEDTSQHVITAQTSQTQLPQDVHTLRQMVQTLLQDVDQKAMRLQDLESQLAWFKRHTFGKRSEKYPVDHPTLFDMVAQGDLAVAEDPKPSKPDKSTASSKRNGRQPLPAHLPREPIEYPLPEDQRVCGQCGQVKTQIGQEVTEELDYIPASFIVRQHIRPKYACKQCQDGVVIADLPDRPVDKGRAGTGLFSHVIVSKYGDHLPLHRQEEIYKRHGLDLRRSTLCDWVAQSADLLKPIALAMKREILQSPKLHTDDTSVPVRNGPRKQIRKGYLWVYVDMLNNVFFDYTRHRAAEGPQGIMSGYTGYIQADGYAGYDALYGPGKASEVACWAHTRRKFYDNKASQREVAHEALVLIGELYKIERQAKTQHLDADALYELRQCQSKPVLAKIDERRQVWAKSVLPQNPISKALVYLNNQWDALNRYTEDPILSIDNNLAERTIRRVTLGRKNWLFAGSDAGGDRAAIHYSLVASCKLCKIDPFHYIKDVLDRISSHPASRITELLPSNWKPMPTEA